MPAPWVVRVVDRLDPRRYSPTWLALVVGIPAFGAAAVELVLVEAGPGASLPGLKSALEAVQAMIALLAAFLLWGRVRRRGSRCDALLLAGFLVLAANSILVVVHLLATPGTPPADGLVWGRIVLRSTGAALLASAALMPASYRIAGSALGIVSVTSMAVVAGLGLTLAEDHLPAAVRSSGGGSAPVILEAVPLVRAFLVLQLVLMAIASWGFLRRARRSHDHFHGALAVGFVVNAASFVAFLGRPSLYSDRVHVGDVLRVLFWAIVLAGAAAEVAESWRAERDLAVLEERRRVARDLHDGLAQELAYISQQAQLLSDGDAPPGAADLMVAASQRALDEARRAISLLRGTAPEPLVESVRQAAEDVAARAGVSVSVRVAEIDLPLEVRETLVRIVREAVLNAARHGRARSVRVSLGFDRVLRVDDDGVGFAAEAELPTGSYGILTMRERAAGVGAVFALTSAPGHGTSVEVALP